MYKPSLSTRNQILTKKYEIFRRKKFEVQDLDLFLEARSNKLTIKHADTALSYTNYTHVSVQHIAHEYSPNISLQIGETKLIFLEPHKFELWLIRRIMRVKGDDKYATLVPKLEAVYDLFRSTRLGHKF